MLEKDQDLNPGQSDGNGKPEGEGDPQPIKVGDKEFTPEQLVELSKKAGQYDELLPEFTRKTQALKELEEEKEGGDWEYPEEFYPDKDKPEEKTKEPSSDEDKLKQKAIGELEEAFGPKIEERVNKQLDSRLKQAEEDRTLELELNRLEKEYSGEDGRPKFERKEIIKHANKTGIFNPEVAYKNLNEESLNEWKETEKDKDKDKNKGTFVEKPGGGEAAPKLPKEKIPQTFEQAEEAMSEMIKGEDK